MAYWISSVDAPNRFQKVPIYSLMARFFRIPSERLAETNIPAPAQNINTRVAELLLNLPGPVSFLAPMTLTSNS
ncbi:MAG: hypothetical protein U0936_06665 [Planctomycetaceae bacterium]